MTASRKSAGVEANDKNHAQWMRKVVDANGRISWFCDKCGKQLTGPKPNHRAGGRRGG